jgi:cobalt-precorrin 5A hydrolase/precorrin-3B C17-methyltransferase
VKVALIAVSSPGAALAAAVQARFPGAQAYTYAAYTLADQTPFETLGGIIQELWEQYEGLVFFCAAGIAIRTIAPYIESKYRDPAVVVCPETGSFAVSLLSGHEGGANTLAERVAAAMDAAPVISTGSEASARITPRNLVLGIGCKRGTTRQKIKEAVETVLRQYRLSVLRIQRICTIDIKQHEAGLVGFAEDCGAPLYVFSPQELNALEGSFSASDFVRDVTGTDSVCERAALVGCGNEGALVVRKTALDGVTVALAERKRVCKLMVVGIGPGNKANMTEGCLRALVSADAIFGYTAYIQLLKPLFPQKNFFATSMKSEVERCRSALQCAAEGGAVALVSSGDAGVYGMASLAYELSPEFPQVAIEVIPGVTAAVSGAAALGSPVGHDFGVLSLSDLLTPWEVIEKRLQALAAGDLVICIYNPASRGRKDHLKRACDILLKILPSDRICAWVRNIGRNEERYAITSLEALRNTAVDMHTTVFIGNAHTRIIRGKMITPRGYPHA